MSGSVSKISVVSALKREMARARRCEDHVMLLLDVLEQVGLQFPEAAKEPLADGLPSIAEIIYTEGRESP